ncbi:flagellar basal body P-ring formation chaperone FlgA [Pseudomonas profundi]|uniref:flagellar basal body P-ring formation chaperone FlgA n=1 Tax=Pseudomonas profundi TaxID=1981513 RepID=UPI00168168EF|nr:flagellar basal body P-ring formation chaperone FlgA [Pseudomonas profundi]
MSIRRLATVLLPPLHRPENNGGKTFSALAFSLLLVGAVDAADNATMQIEQAANTYLDRMIKREAERSGWRDLTYSLNISPLSDSSAFASCSQPLDVTQTSGRPTPLDRMRLELRCPDQPGWTQTVSTRQDLFLPVLTTATNIDRGQAIEPGHLTRERINISRAQRGFMVDESEVAGLSARRRLRAGQALNASLLNEAAPVRRGQPVRILARQDGIEASTQGEALAEGSFGDVIRVRNTSSDTVIQAQVTGPGEVTSTWE